MARIATNAGPATRNSWFSPAETRPAQAPACCTRQSRAGLRAHGGALRYRRRARRCRSGCVVRAARPRDGGIARCRGPRKPRPRARGNQELRVRLPAAARHGQSGAGGRPQGGSRVRSADCTGRSGRLGRGRPSRHSRRPGPWRTVVDGSMHPTRGVLPIAATARRVGYQRLLVPSANALEAAVVTGIDVLPVDSLTEAVAVLERSRSSAHVADGRAAGGGQRRARPCRRPRPGVGPSRTRGRSGRRTQPPVRWPSGRGQDDDGAATPGAAPTAELRGIAGSDDRALGRRAVSRGRQPDSLHGPFAPLTTRSPTRRSLVAVRCRVPERSAWRTTACSFSTSSLSSPGAPWKCCGSRSNTERSRSHARHVPRCSLRASCWSPRWTRARAGTLAIPVAAADVRRQSWRATRIACPVRSATASTSSYLSPPWPPRIWIARDQASRPTTVRERVLARASAAGRAAGREC